jgi:hypothetical protein
LVAHFHPDLICFVGDSKKPAGESPAGFVLLISLAVYIRPWQSAGMECP